MRTCLEFRRVLFRANATRTKTTTVNGTVTNVFTADGAFDDPAASKAKETALATVTGHDCGISLRKTPNVTSVCNGTTVTYTYVITNNSDAFSWVGSLEDDLI